MSNVDSHKVSNRWIPADLSSGRAGKKRSLRLFYGVSETAQKKRAIQTCGSTKVTQKLAPQVASSPFSGIFGAACWGMEWSGVSTLWDIPEECRAMGWRPGSGVEEGGAREVVGEGVFCKVIVGYREVWY